jgi:hypothetical protein
MRIPYVVSWSGEEPKPATLITVPRSGIAYTDECLLDRDKHGVLWPRVPSLPGRGHPEFGKIHPLRQRRAMTKLLCAICAGEPDRNDQGTLWLVRDFRDWPNWPEGMACSEPPVCLPCAQLSVRHCPNLRQGYAALRVRHSEVAAVYGIRYRPTLPFPTAISDDIVPLDDPAIRWTRAAHLIRELRDCTIIDLDQQTRA